MRVSRDDLNMEEHDRLMDWSEAWLKGARAANVKAAQGIREANSLPWWRMIESWRRITAVDTNMAGRMLDRSELAQAKAEKIRESW